MLGKEKNRRYLEVRRFKNVRFKGDWEYNFITRWGQLRLGRSHIALWADSSKPVFSWMRKGVK